MPKFSSLPETRLQVADRAGHCCEYCKSMDNFSPNYFTLDHILPELLGGTDSIGQPCLRLLPLQQVEIQ